MRLGFSDLLGTLSCVKICINLLRIHYKKNQKSTYLIMIMRFFSDFLYKGICCGNISISSVSAVSSSISIPFLPLSVR